MTGKAAPVHSLLRPIRVHWHRSYETGGKTGGV